MKLLGTRAMQGKPRVSVSGFIGTAHQNYGISTAITLKQADMTVRKRSAAFHLSRIILEFIYE